MENDPRRRVIWEGTAERITLIDEEDGSACLVRSTDYDSGAAQSVRIPAEAVQQVAAEFWSLSIRRTMAQVADAIARVKALPFGRDL